MSRFMISIVQNQLNVYLLFIWMTLKSGTYFHSFLHDFSMFNERIWEQEESSWSTANMGKIAALAVLKLIMNDNNMCFWDVKGARAHKIELKSTYLKIWFR